MYKNSFLDVNKPNSTLTNNEYRRFKIELEAINKEKDNYPIMMFMKSTMEKIAREKKDNYDFKVSSLFDFYNIENKNLFDDLDKIWDVCYENIINSKNFLRLIITTFYTPSNNDRYLYEELVRKYKELVCIYCCKFVEGLING
jgi:hypothetical protein CLOST_1274